MAIIAGIKKDFVKQLFHIEANENRENIQPVLSIRLGEKYCCFSVTDFSSNELKRLNYYSTEYVDENFLQELFSTHAELSSNYYQVLISYDYPQSSLVPFKDYQHGNGSLLMSILHGVNGTANVVAEPVSAWQLYNVYAVPKDVQEWVGKNFSSAKYWHQYSLGIKNIKPATIGGSLLVDLRKDDFAVLVAGNSNILLAQTFLYSTPDDIIFTLLKICEQFNLSPQEVHISLTGLIDQHSALYRELYQYFLQVEFRNANWLIPASAQSESPLHFFTSLNDLSQCAS